MGCTSQATQTKLVDLLEGIWILPVVLDDVDVVGGGQEARKGRRLGVPQRSGDDAWTLSVAGLFSCLVLSSLLGSSRLGLHARLDGPFWVRMFRLFCTRRAVSRMIRR